MLNAAAVKMNSFSFPADYYQISQSTSFVNKNGKNWFCNRPLSPVTESVQHDSVTSTSTDENNSSTDLRQFQETEHEFISNEIPDVADIPEQTPEENRHENFVNEIPDVELPLQSPEIYESMDDTVKDPDYEPDSSEDKEIISCNSGAVNAENEDPLRHSCNNTLESFDSSNPSCLSSRNSDQTITAECNLSTTDLGEYKLNGEIRKGNKKKDFCSFCETLVLNFSRHVQRNHSLEVEVQNVFSHAPNSKERKQLLEVLRKKGNYLNSNNICKPMQKLRSNNKLLPCTNCLGFYSSSILWRHRIKCLGSKDKAHQSKGQNLIISGLNIDRQLKEFVFPKMRPDEISFVAKKDPLICAYGARYMKIHREKHFINVTSRKMRELARLLIEVKNREPSVTCLFDVLKPINFDLLVEATKVVAKYDKEKDVFESPTYAINMGTTLKQCAELAIVFALKRKHIAETVTSANAEADLKTLIKIIESQWQYEVSTQAANDLSINKWNKITMVPLASDLRLLKQNLITKANCAVEALRLNNNDKENYKTLLETIFCRIMLLNRRRPGELQRMSIDTYNKVLDRDTSNYEEFSEVITPSEKILLKTFKRVVIRGKRGRGVPVLFSPDIQEHINVLFTYRVNFVDKKNIYLFANPNSFSPICGYKVLQKYASMCGAKNPKAITSTKLRKHLATLTQVFSMSENDLEQLAHFMGHTIGVHKGSYRLPDDVYQTAKISKLLLLMEKGQAGQFKGKDLDHIDVNLDENLLIENSHDDSDVDQPAQVNSPITTQFNDENHNTDNVNSVTQKKITRTLTPWTADQKKVVTAFFSDHIKHKRPPKKIECMELKQKYPDMLDNKDWSKIKVYIQNVYTKKTK